MPDNKISCLSIQETAVSGCQNVADVHVSHTWPA